MIGLTLTQVLTGIQKWSRSALLEPGFAANNCIQSTRTLQDVLMHFGYYSRPLTVHAFVHNPPLWKAIKAHAEEGGPAVPHHTDAEYDKRGYHGMGVMRGNPGSGWDGHLVLYFEHEELDQPVIIDGSFDQFSRPQKKMEIPIGTILAHVPEGFADAEESVVLELPTGVGVIYKSQPRDHTYIRAPDWMQYGNRPLYTKIRDRIIQAIVEEART